MITLRPPGGPDRTLSNSESKKELMRDIRTAYAKRNVVHVSYPDASNAVSILGGYTDSVAFIIERYRGGVVYFDDSV
jgi:hypothetical protein